MGTSLAGNPPQKNLEDSQSYTGLELSAVGYKVLSLLMFFWFGLFSLSLGH